MTISGCSEASLHIGFPGREPWGDLGWAREKRAALKGDWEKASYEWTFGETGLRAKARFY